MYFYLLMNKDFIIITLLSIKKKNSFRSTGQRHVQWIAWLSNWGLDIKESIHKDWKLKRIHKEVNIPL